MWLAFAGKLMPGAGLVKHDSHAADAFRVVPQVADVGPFGPRYFSDMRLAVLTLSPGMPAAMLAASLAELDGAVLRVFGAGTTHQFFNRLDHAGFVIGEHDGDERGAA